MKRVIQIILSLSFVLCLCGCHGSSAQSDFEMPEEFDTSRDYEITFWAKNDSNKNQIAVYKQAISNFEKLYPNITVTLKLYTDYGRIYNDVITNISTGTTPNVCVTYPDHIATYITGSNTVVNLDNLMDDENYGLGGSKLLFDGPKKDEIVSEFLKEGIISGSQYALPFMRSTEALYINEDYVKKLGYEIPDVLTWDFVFEVSEAALRKNEDGTYYLNNQNVMIPFMYKSTDNMMITMLKQLNASYSDEDGTNELFNETTSVVLKQIAEHASTGAFSTFAISSYPANYLNAGQCVFAVDSTAGSTWMGSSAPNLDIAKDAVVNFNTVVRMVPQYDVDNPKMISQGPSICIFNKADNQEVLASWLFAQFLLTDEVQVAYSKTEGYAPVTYKAQNSEAYQEYVNNSGAIDDEHYSVKIDALNLLTENMHNTFITNVFNGSTSLRSAAGQLVESVTRNARNGKTIDDAYLDELYESIISLYRLDQSTRISADKDLGPLPTGSKVLLGSLAGVWIGIIGYLIYKKIKEN